jgi:hypothetical protein
MRLPCVVAFDLCRRRLLIDKPIEHREYRDEGYPGWSGRALLWDTEKDEPRISWVLPGYSRRDFAVLPDGRIATLNSNGTIYIIRP